MSAPPIAIMGAGLMTGVGLTAPASCAAIRCGIDNFRATQFVAGDGNWIVGSEVRLEQPWRGLAKLVRLLAGPVRECLDLEPDLSPSEIPLLLCIAEKDRSGRLDGLDEDLFLETEKLLGVRFHEASRVYSLGRVGPVAALVDARRLLHEARRPRVIIAGVDSYLVAATLQAYDEQDRLLTERTTDGFIPGEAGGAILVGGVGGEVVCRGLGFARETATVTSDIPLRADGLVRAIDGALSESGRTLAEVDYRLTDLSGEQYRFKEAALALTRLLRERKAEFDLWHPADCIGETGASALPAMLAVALFAARKHYAPGSTVLCHLGNDDGKRAALVLASGRES